GSKQSKKKGSKQSKKKGSKQSKKKRSKEEWDYKKGMLTVEVVSGENIKKPKADTNIYVKLHLGNDSDVTKSKKYQKHITWNQKFDFPIKNIAEKLLGVIIVSNGNPQKKGNDSFKIGLKDLIESDDGEMNNVEFKIPNSQSGTTLVMSLSYSEEDENEEEENEEESEEFMQLLFHLDQFVNTFLLLLRSKLSKKKKKKTNHKIYTLCPKSF
ncbi:AMP dependent ligase/synthetase, partial [Reticulomyxa filosa]